MSDCIFCRIVDNAIPSKKVHEDNQCLAFEDINPQARVHILVIPKRHLSSLSDAQSGDGEVLGHLMLMCAKIARDKGIEDSGYRVVTNKGAQAGQTVFHLHFHILGGREFAWPPG